LGGSKSFRVPHFEKLERSVQVPPIKMEKILKGHTSKKETERRRNAQIIWEKRHVVF